MKQTVSIFAPDINVVSKFSAIQTWLNSENVLFSMVMESSINNFQMLLMGHACLSFSALICASCVSVVPALLLPSMVCHFVVSMQERRSAMKINGLKLTDEALDSLRILQEDNNSTINGIQEGIYEIEELVLNPEADASYGDRLVMMQTLRDIRHLFDLIKVLPGHKY